MKKRTDIAYIAAEILMGISLLAFCLRAYRRECVTAGLVMAVIYVVSSLRQKEKRQLSFIAAGCMLCAVSIADLIWHCFVLIMMFRFLAFLIGIAESIRFLWKKRYIWKKKYPAEQFNSIVHIFVLASLAVMMTMLSVHALSPAGFARHYVKKEITLTGIEDTFTPQYVYHKDLSFTSPYSDSTFDLIETDQKEPAGTLIWVHGGRYVSGDKAAQDNSTQLFRNALKEGYDVVMCNYAKAPETLYPAPLYQLDALISALPENDVPTERLVLCGTGSGGDIVMQYTTACLNPQYAERTGFYPSCRKEQIDGIFVSCAVFTPHKGMNTGYILSDYIADELLCAYYGVKDLESAKAIRNADVMPYITEVFPPVFLTAGNTGAYAEQAHRLEAILNKHNVPCTSFIFDAPTDERQLIGMEFDTEYTQPAKTVHGKMITFLRNLK